jgi:hypothetical protein
LSSDFQSGDSHCKAILLALASLRGLRMLQRILGLCADATVTLIIRACLLCLLLLSFILLSSYSVT